VAEQYKETPSGYDDGRDDDECDGHTVTDDNDKDEFSMKQTYKDRINKICSENDTRLIQDEIFHQKCIERVSPADTDTSKFCLRAVTKKKYLSNDQDWKDLICKDKFIHGKQRIMMDCLLYRLGRDNETMYKHIKRACKMKFYPPEDPRVTMTTDTVEDTVYKELCMNPVREELKKKFLKHLQVKCLKERANSVIGNYILLIKSSKCRPFLSFPG